MRSRTVAALAAAWLVGAPVLAIPQFAQAQHDYGRADDICAQQKADAGKKGAVAGAVIGGIIGSAAAGRRTGDRVAGAVIGGTAGAVAGNAIARSSVKCMPYPRRVGYHRPQCRWVSEHYDGRDHEFEVCRDRDGVWRPSGRG